MELTTFCYIVTIVEFVFGIPLLVYPKQTTAWIMKLMNDDILSRVMWFMFLVLGFLVLIKDSSVDTSVPGFVRLIAWITVVKSLVLCWWPQWLTRQREKVWSNPITQRIASVAVIAIGVVFMLAGNALR